MKRVLSILSNILNKNNNNLLTLSIDYLTYFYYYYSQLLKTFPNLFSKSFIIQIDNLKKYINCSLIRFKSNINYLSSISTSMNSSKSNIQSLTRLIPQFEGLINNVFCKLKSAITLNITLLCLRITPIWNIVKCFNKEIHGAVDIICATNKLICKCKSSIIESLENCLKQIKCKLIELHPIFLTLRDKFGEINYLITQSSSVKLCPHDLPMFKSKISLLEERYKCSTMDFGCIQNKIKCAKSIIAVITQKKKELCKKFDEITSTICIKFTLSFFPISISLIDKIEVQKKLKLLTENIDKICSELEKIEDNTSKLKHSLMFNHMYFQISSHILNELKCIESQQKTLCEKLSDLKDVPSHINVISGNIKDVKSMFENVYEGRDDLGYVRDSLCSIMPKLCEIKESATKITKLECIIEPLRNIKCSIDNLKDIDSEEKCLEIFEFTDKCALIQTLTCIRDRLDINCITAKFETVKNSISSLESVISNTNKLLGCFEIIENISSVIEYLKRNINKLANKFLRCSLESLTANILTSNRSDIRDAEVGNPVMNMYSVMSVMDYMVAS